MLKLQRRTDNKGRPLGIVSAAISQALQDTVHVCVSVPGGIDDVSDA